MLNVFLKEYSVETQSFVIRIFHAFEIRARVFVNCPAHSIDLHSNAPIRSNA
jgi:hypothetical protein